MGNLPSPQSLNEPKSLYHCPSETFGFDSIQTRNWLRSVTPMLRSCIRSTRWSRMAAGSRDQFSIWGMAHPGLFAKDEATQFVAQLFHLTWIAGCAEAFGELEKRFLFLLSGLDALLDEFH